MSEMRRGRSHSGMPWGFRSTSRNLSLLGPEKLCATIEIHLRFLRPVFGSELRADTRVVHRGKRIVQLESKLLDAEEHLVATATGSFAVIPRPSG